MILHSPLYLLFPIFTLTVLAYASVYMVVHRKSHQHVQFFKKWLPWHYEHHMGKNQDANWGVTTDWPDRLLKTREKY